MKTMHILKLSFIIVMLHISVASYSQLTLELGVNGGGSDCSYVYSNQDGGRLSNNYIYSPSIATDFTLRYSLNEKSLLSGLSFSSGLNFVVRTTCDNGQPVEFVKRPREEQYYYISVPIYIAYAAEKWLHLRVGITNNFTVGYSVGSIKWAKKYVTANPYFTEFVCGVDFIIAKSFIAGLTYHHSLNSFSKEYIPFDFPDHIKKTFRRAASVKLAYIIPLNKK